MANDRVRVVVDNVRGTISNFQQRRGEFQVACNTLKGILFDLSGTWKGAAESAYERKFRTLVSNLGTINHDVDGAIEKMNLALNTYSELEANLSDIAIALDAGASTYVQ